MRRLLLIVGLRAGNGPALDWPGHRRHRLAEDELHDHQLHWAGYGAALAALGLILIWQSQR